MTHPDSPQINENPRLGRRRFFGVAGAAAAAAATGAGTLRPWRNPGGPVVSLYPLDQAASPPDGVRLGVQRVIWSVETSEPAVALTFDDGPDDELTPAVLDILDDFGVKATFFLVGLYVTQRPDLVREVLSRGHEIGNHTWTHPDLTRADPDEVRRQLEWCEDAIYAAAEVTTPYFRPPRGLLSGVSVRLARESSKEIVLWSVGRGVAGVGTPEAISSHILDTVAHGDVVGLHDGTGREAMRTDLEGPGYIRLRRRAEIEALPSVLEGLADRGVHATTVSGLLATRSGVERA
jgi:peptidoglycan-N-acetylglucosamine deacetylase